MNIIVELNPAIFWLVKLYFGKLNSCVPTVPTRRTLLITKWILQLNIRSSLNNIRYFNVRAMPFLMRDFVFASETTPPDGMLSGSGELTVSKGEDYKCKAFQFISPFASGEVRVQLRLCSEKYSAAVTCGLKGSKRLGKIINSTVLFLMI